LKGLIKASLKVDLDYRKMLSLFKTSVLSSRRRLTRMRPNRRFGFDAMGSRYELSTNLLIAVDVSGSVTDKSLEFFFSVINRLFKYGIEKLDVLQFDAAIQGNIEPLKKARRTVKILGRGGTCFQPAADYYCEHPEYDGLIYFSDGYAPPPVYNTKRPIDVLWVLCSKSAYEANGNTLKELKRNRVTYIPRSE
jgi:predicted metal-dependent peptidase